MCELHDVYNSTTCEALYPLLPQCLDKLDYALNELTSAAETRRDALVFCGGLFDGDMHGTVLQDIRKTVRPRRLSAALPFRSLTAQCKDGDLGVCYPEFVWMNEFFRLNKTKKILGVPEDIEWSSVNINVCVIRYKLL